MFDKNDLENDYDSDSENDDNQSFLTEDNIKRAFVALDTNRDGKIHKEEFISALTRAYQFFFSTYNNDSEIGQKLFTKRRGLAFAYSCMTPKELAIATAVECYGIITSTSTAKGNPTYYLSYNDLYAWYLFSGREPFRDLMVHALDSFLELGGDRRPLPTLQRSKSSVNLISKNQQQENSKLNNKNSKEGSVDDFVSQCQQLLKLSSPGSASYLSNLLLMASSPSPEHTHKHNPAPYNHYLTREKYTKTFLSYLSFNGTLKRGPQQSQSQALLLQDSNRLHLIDTIFDISSTEFSSPDGEIVWQANEKVPVSHVISLLTVLCDSDLTYLQNYQSLFDVYKLRKEEYVNEIILHNHLSQVLLELQYFLQKMI